MGSSLKFVMKRENNEGESEIGNIGILLVLYWYCILYLFIFLLVLYWYLIGIKLILYGYFIDILSVFYWTYMGIL